MPKEVDLDQVSISPEIFTAWHELAGRVAVVLAQMVEMGREIPPIPDKRTRVNDDGTLTVYVEIPGVLMVSMDVPAEQWAYGNPNN